MNCEEKWLPVDGYNGIYEVSDLGRVKRVAGGSGARAGKVLKPLNKDGYRRVVLTRDGVQRMLAVHRLVARAFIGPCPRGWVCHHKNSERSDNRPENLEWITRERNTSLGSSGEGNGSAKLNTEALKVLRWEYNKGRSAALLGRLYGVSHSAAWEAASGRSWAE